MVIDGTKDEPHYFSGPRYIAKVQEFHQNCPNYGDYIGLRERAGVSTTRRDYFKDLLLVIEESKRAAFVKSILEEVQIYKPKSCNEIRKMIGSGVLAPFATIPTEAWNADRLNEFLKEMDEALQEENYGRTVTLAYTCLEGFFKTFVRENIPEKQNLKEIIELAREVKDYLKASNKQYPDDVLNLVTQTAHALNKTRDRFSESHFGDETDRWLATYMRDVVNTQIRLLLHFM
jgi:hypothetical protein